MKTRRKPAFANKLQRDLFLLISLAAIVPSIIVAIALYYLIFNITASQFLFPEAIAYNLIPASKKVLAVLFIGMPVSILLILALAFKITHKIIGPYNRVIKELDSLIEGKRHTHIQLRKSDTLQPLVDRINRLIDKIKG